jgi:flagellar basal-body rod protein FlgG
VLKGIYSSVAGMQAAEARQQVLASNLANANTPGYKSNDVTTQSFESLFATLFDTSQTGTGALSAGDRLDLSQGTLEQTGGRLDVALDGDGFFVLNGPNGPLYTRAGRLSLDASGVLRSPDGFAIAGANGQQITALGSDVRIQNDGTVLSDGTPAGRIQVVSLDQNSLVRAGTSTFTSTAAPTASQAKVVSGALEGSNVDPTAAMTAMTLLLRAFEAGRQAVQLQNETLGAAVNQVGALH